MGECKFCGETHAKLHQHENYRCKKNPDRKKEYKSGNCQHCGEYFTALRQHEKYCKSNPEAKNLLEERSGNCRFCGDHYAALRQHEQHYCKSNPNRKAAVKSGECQHCGGQFNDLRKHKKYYCKSNPNRKILNKRHRSGNCQYCGKFFAGLTNHEQHHCQSNPDRVPIDRSGNCQYCGQFYQAVQCHEQNHCPENPDLDLDPSISQHEKYALEYLTSIGVEFEHRKTVPVDGTRYYPDFVLGDQIIEIDGIWWHDPDHDEIRDARLNSLGYHIHRVPVKGRITEKTRRFIESRIDRVIEEYVK